MKAKVAAIINKASNVREHTVLRMSVINKIDLKSNVLEGSWGLRKLLPNPLYRCIQLATYEYDGANR